MVGDNEHCHFMKFGVESEVEWLKNNLHLMFHAPFDRQLFPPIATCIGAILKKVTTLLSRRSQAGLKEKYSIHSEAELRFAIIDPMIEMLCDCWVYQVTKCTCSLKATLAPTGEAGGDSEGSRR